MNFETGDRITWTRGAQQCTGEVRRVFDNFLNVYEDGVPRTVNSYCEGPQAFHCSVTPDQNPRLVK